jgi:hypothetical protein
MTGGLHPSASPEVWIGAALTLAVFSYLWRDNPFYKLAEHVFVGASAAYVMVLGFWTTLWPNAVEALWPGAARLTNPEAVPGRADPVVLLPVLLGLLMLCRLNPRTAWLSRWPTAFAIGTSAGYNLVRYLRSDFLTQIQSGVAASLVVVEAGRVQVGASLSNAILLAGTICGLVYFTYTREHRGGVARMARLGVLFMMVTFGTTFGYTVMARISLLVSRLRFLLGDWLGLV